MADLTVRPSYVFGPRDILDAAKLNLLATPVVELALEDPVNDQNYVRNGNFYSSFWTTPAGVSCPINVWTSNASYWLVRPQGAAVTYLRSPTVPDQFSLYTAEIQGAVSVTTVEIGQQINGDLSATLRRNCTFSGNIYNSTGLTMSPVLNIYTADAFNNFSTITLRTTVNLQTCSNATWTYVSATVDVSTLTNAANGLLVAIQLPSGAINDPAKNVLFSRLKFQIGEIATEFVDDVSLFVQAPSVDSTMLQDGCIARPSLFLPNVIPTGTYQAKSIKSGDIGDKEIKTANLDTGISTATAANFTVPAVGANVLITMVSAAAFSAGLSFTVQGAGSYQTVSIAGNVVTAQNLGIAGNAAPGTVINSGANVTTGQNAVIGCLGFTPINKSGDTGIGKLESTVDTVVGTSSPATAAVVVHGTSANANNTGYFPAISFDRPSVKSRAIGLSTTGRFQTVDQAGGTGYLLDTVTGVDTNSYQDGSITLQKLATTLVNILIAPGTIHAFAGSGVPSGWLWCDGSAVSRTTYAALYAAIGVLWGIGNGTTTFNLPDLRGRAPIGYCNTPATGITSRAYAERLGEETHVITTAELAVHTHGVTDPTHYHVIEQSAHTHGYVNPTAGTVTVAGGSNPIYQPGGSTQTAAAVAGTGSFVDAAATGIALQNTGSGAAHNNMMPYAVLSYIIKT
jgi:microcystin-dependent protein